MIKFATNIEAKTRDITTMGGFFCPDAPAADFNLLQLRRWRAATAVCSVLHPGLCKHRDFLIYHDVIRMSGQLNVFITHNVGKNSVVYSLFRFSHGEVRKYSSCRSCC